MIKTLSIALLALSFISCANSQPVVQNPKIERNKKLFAQEDYYILVALRAEELRDFISASQLYTKLYNKTEREEYLYKALQSDIAVKNYQLVLDKIDSLVTTKEQDNKIIRFYIVALIGLLEIEKAKELTVTLVKNSQEDNDYILLSSIYLQLKENELALSTLENLYNKNFDEEILENIGTVLYIDLERKEEAISKLEMHTKTHGCSQRICRRLANFYSDTKDLEGILSIYLRLYENFKDEKIAKKIIQIYSYQKEYLKLENFLESSKSDDKVLLQLYTTTQNYKKAYVLANEIYIKTGNIDYLGQSAIYQYESAKDKNSEEILENIVKKLIRVIDKDKNPLYLNYLGYLLIDHNLDISRGIEYVKSALKIEPNSAFYLDSLAWGYYKQGNCKDAKKIMNQVIKLDESDNEEVIFHINSIDKCLKN